MDILLIVLGSILMLVGILGCILPIIPGPPISFIAILLMHWTDKYSFSDDMLLGLGLMAAGVSALDYIVPIYGTKKFGGTKKGIWGSTIGLLLGIFIFPPFGIIIGPLIGAYLGELSAGQNSTKAMRSAFGSFLGFLTGTLLKFIACFVMTYYYVVHLL
ncbi:MAG: hypothetical protein ACJAS3_001191 [Roseivirga sp.]|jgi:uncharacterized protein YqgC (DUF456 family)